MMAPSSYRAIGREQDLQRRMKQRVADAAERRAAAEPCPRCGKVHPRQPLGIASILGVLGEMDHDADEASGQGGPNGSLQ